MSTLQVQVLRAVTVTPHPNADRLDIATIGQVGGWQCVVARGSVKAGDLVVYFPIDSVIPPDLMDRLFATSKVRPEAGRIRTTKIRGVISQGLAVPVRTLLADHQVREGMDVTARLGVKKYEPPITIGPQANVRMVSPREANPNFFRYTDIEHLRKFPQALEGKDVIITEKLHGTNFRAGWVPKVNLKWWQRPLTKLGLVSGREFVWGSHNVQLQNKLYRGNDYYSRETKNDVYTEQVVKCGLRDRLPHDTVIYGEIIGDGIQKGYTYGCRAGERELVLFDAMVGGQYVEFPQVVDLARRLGLRCVPVLYEGKFSMEVCERYACGASALSNEIREGVVVRPRREEYGPSGRLIYKLINPDYLLKGSNTEFH